MKISQLEGQFYGWSRYDRNLSPVTIEDYKRSLRVFKKDIGDLEVEEIKLDHFSKWKQRCLERGVGAYCLAGYLFNMRSFLKYCQYKGFKVIDPSEIKPPKFRRKKVIYLTNEEVKKFSESIDISTIEGLRNRTLVETLLGTGVRISEALRLNREDIKNGEAEIIGKGGKERTIYFSDRALKWINEYLKVRKDKYPPLFAAHCKRGRLSATTIQEWFPKYRREIGMDYKPISAHIMRHTFCTNLKNNGCNLFDIQHMAGHENIKTTVDNYIGIDEGEIKKSHQKYLNYDR